MASYNGKKNIKNGDNVWKCRWVTGGNREKGEVGGGGREKGVEWKERENESVLK